MKNYLLIVSFLFCVACSDSSSNKNSPSNQQDSVPPNGAQNSHEFAKRHTLQKLPTKLSQQKTNKQDLHYNADAEFKILSITEGLFKNAPALQVNLSLPVDASQNLASLLQVYAGDKNNRHSVTQDWVLSENQRVLYFPFIEAETHYKIVVDDNLFAINGKKIANPQQKELNSRPYRKMVRFTSKGSTLLKESSVLPIEAVNVSAVDLKFWRVHADKYAEFLQMEYRREISTLETMYEVADVVYTAEFALDNVKNTRNQHDISLKNIEEVQKPGLYFVTMLPHDAYSYNIANTWFMSTDIGLHARLYPNSLVVFTHKIPQAETYAGINILLMDQKGNIITEGQTDADGFVAFETSKLDEIYFVIAQKGDNFNLIRMKQPKMDLSEFALSNRKYHAQELFLYAPRDLYRPGEKVNINGLLRSDDGEFVKASPIKVEVKRPNSRVFKSFTWQGDESSLYQSQFSIPKDAATGTWSFVAVLGNKDRFVYTFHVEDFLPERLKLDLAPLNEHKQLATDEVPVVKIQSDYLYGAPAAGNTYDATVSIRATTYLFEDYQDYEFGAKDYYEYNQSVDTAKAKLDANGFAQLKVKNSWAETQFPLRVKTTVNVYESGGRPISRKTVHNIWPHDVAIGVRPAWIDDDFDFASPNSSNEINLIAINKKGERISLPEVEVLLIRANDRRYWHWGDDGWSYSESEKNVPVFSTIVNLNKSVVEKVNLPVQYGNYFVELRTRDQVLISRYKFFAGWRWYDEQYQNGERPDQVKLAWQADNVTPGEDNELKITAPFSGIAMITVENDEILWKKSIELSNAEQVLKIPVAKDWKRHDIHVSVMVIAKGDVKRKHLPKRAFGVIHLPLNRDNRKLDISIENPAKVLPESKVTIKIKAKNLQNKPTYVTLAAVDTGVLNVSNFKTPKPFAWYFSPRQYIAQLHDMYSSIIAFGEGLSTRQKFGGDEDINRGGDAPQSDVQIVSLFSDKVSFNSQGVAEISLDLPYFNGEVRLMAMAFNDNQFAGVDARMKIAAPVVVSASLPRFIAKGDASFATIDVHNTEDFSQNVNINISADKALGSQKQSTNIKLAAKEKQIIKLPIKAKFYNGQGTIHVNADVSSAKKGKNNYHMERDWHLGIRPALPAVTQTQMAVIPKGTSFSSNNAKLANFDTINLKSILKVSNTPVLNAQDHFRHLIQYPYGCLEQTSSRLWPLLQVEKSDLALFPEANATKIFTNRSELISSAIGRILGMQRYDGSFGLWDNNSPEEKWLTVYATDLLLNAKKLGYSISETALNKAIKRLGKYVKDSSRISSDLSRYLSNKPHYLLAYKAYASYVLAGIKQVNLQDVRALFDHHKKDAKTPLPLAHLAFALELLGDERRADEAWLKAIDLKSNDNKYYYYGDYGSNIRDLSQVIYLGNQSHVNKNSTTSALTLIPQLLDQLKGKRWLSTQERAAVFRLAKALEKNKAKGEKWQLKLTHNNYSDDYQQSEDLLKTWFAQDAKNGFALENISDKPLYIDFKTQGYYKNAIPASNGIKVERHYFDLNGNEISIKKLKTGDKVLVYIGVSLDKKYSYLPQAILVDLLPAGLELENQNLEHSYKFDEIKLNKKYVWQWQNYNHINHTEYRDDRFITALSLSQYSRSHIFYLVRAVTPGTYSIPPTLVEDMYHPEIRAVGADEGQMVITE